MFCNTYGISLRGHTIFWAVDQFVQSWVTNLSNADLQVHLTNRINSAVNHFKGTFRHWDVNNEMLHGNFFGNRLGNWVNPWMFQHARLQDTNVTLFVNDYNVVAGNETDAYKQQILSLIASNAWYVPTMPTSGANTPITAQRVSSRSPPSAKTQW